MTVKELEQRVMALEQELKQLRTELAVGNNKPNRNWLGAVEKYVGDEDLLSIFADAQKLRAADRKKTRIRPKSQRKPKT